MIAATERVVGIAQDPHMPQRLVLLQPGTESDPAR